MTAIPVRGARGPGICQYPAAADEDSLSRKSGRAAAETGEISGWRRSSEYSKLSWLDQESVFMVKEQQGTWVVPNPQIPRSFGLMNIIFGALLILVAGVSVFSYFIGPKLFGRLQQDVLAQQAARKAERESQIADLKTKEDAAKTKEEKADFHEQRTALEAEAKITLDLSELTDYNELSGLNDIRVFTYYAVELAAAIILNILMIVAGAGLMGLTGWGRRLAIWVAQLKILRWVLMTIVSMVLILPISLDRSQKIFAKVEAQQKAQGAGRPAPIGVSDLARIGVIAGAVTTIFSAVIASIYPVLSIWFLTRPQARAACLRGLKTLQGEAPIQPGEV
jgi:hypothetical protein